MISLAKLNIPKYFIADAVSSIRRENEFKLVQKLQSNLMPTYLLVKDTSLGANSCGPMYKIVVESPCFKEKTKLEQHKMVMDALSDDMEQIHAVNLKTRTPSELNVLSMGIGIMPESELEKLVD